MPLTTHIKDRFGSTSPFLVNLTNHDDDDASVINEVRLSKSAESAEGQFETMAQVAYDDANAAHIDAGVLGMIAYLRMWSSSQGKAESEFSSFHDALGQIGSISSRKRITPIQSIRLQQDTDEDLFLGLSPQNPEIGGERVR